MKRIDKALSIMKGKTKEEILGKYCPGDAIITWPNFDGATWDQDKHGCHGVSCEECWNKEVLEHNPKTMHDWISATDEEISEMNLDEAIAIVKNQIEKGKRTEFRPRVHVTHALEMVLKVVEKMRKEDVS